MTIAGANLGELTTAVLPAGYFGIRPFLFLGCAYTHLLLLWSGNSRLALLLAQTSHVLRAIAANPLISKSKLRHYFVNSG